MALDPLVWAYGIVSRSFAAALGWLNSLNTAMPLLFPGIIWAFSVTAVVNLFILPVRGAWVATAASDLVPKPSKNKVRGFRTSSAGPKASGYSFSSGGSSDSTPSSSSYTS